MIFILNYRYSTAGLGTPRSKILEFEDTALLSSAGLSGSHPVSDSSPFTLFLSRRPIAIVLSGQHPSYPWSCGAGPRVRLEAPRVHPSLPIYACLRNPVCNRRPQRAGKSAFEPPRSPTVRSLQYQRRSGFPRSAGKYASPDRAKKNIVDPLIRALICILTITDDVISRSAITFPHGHVDCTRMTTRIPVGIPEIARAVSAPRHLSCRRKGPDTLGSRCYS